MSRSRSSTMTLARATASNSAAIQSCGSIWMVWRFWIRPRPASTLRLKAGQSISGYADRCAL
ncbi:Uncharacterised protein [Bordetella pertussis]|nr:Uncharacterised protein [Bordetella pertussis]